MAQRKSKQIAEQLWWQAHALAQVTDAIVAIDNDHRIIYWNQAAEQLYNFKLAEVYGHRVEEVNSYRWLNAEDESAAYAALAATGSWHGENTHLKKSGEVIHVESTVSILRDLNGADIGLLAVIRDITDRKRAEAESRKQKEILQQIFDHLPVMLNFIDQDGHIQLVNRCWERTLGWSLEEIQQQNVDILVESYPDPQQRQAVVNAIAKANGEWNDFKARLRDGRLIATTWANIKLSDGTSIGIGQDITTRKQAEAESQQLASYLKILHEIDRAILTAPSAEAILQVTTGLCREIGPYLRADVALFDVAKHGAELVFVQTLAETALGVGTQVSLEAMFGTSEDLKQGKFHLIEDLRKSSDPFLVALQTEGICSYLSVPLVSHGRLIGSLNLGSDKVNGFDAEVINTVHEVSDALALALQQANLLETEQKTRQMAETLQKATTALAASLDIEQVLDNILNNLFQIMGYDGAAVLLFEEDRLNVSAARSLALFEQMVGNAIPTESPLFKQVQRGEQPFILRRDELTAWLQQTDQLLLPTPEHWLVAPLNLYGAITGSLILSKGQGRIYLEQEIGLAQTFAHQAAIAIHNAQMYQAVQRQREELRFLTTRITETVEGERRQVARELHDQVGQNLTALNFTLSALQAELPTDLIPMIQKRLDDAEKLIAETGQQIRGLMAELRPAVLDDYGLLAALRWYSEYFSQRTAIHTTVVSVDPIQRLALTLETTLFRIAQEALTNVAKHARASAATITLQMSESAVSLMIADNGVGLAVNWRERVGQTARWGLLNMSERAAALGGHLKVRSAPGQGTQVFVEIPR